MPFIKTISIESYLPKILKNYTAWTIHICQKCGKAEIFMHKKKAGSSARNRYVVQ